MTERQSATTAELHPALALASILGLIALGLLPLAGGGYSGAGYQLGFVLLPLAAALAWAVARRRPPLATVVLLLCLLSGALLPFFIQPGRDLWFYALHIPAAWIVVWVLLGEVPQRSRHLLWVLSGGALVSALYGWFLWIGAGQLDYQLTGTFGLHNAYAGFLLLAWPTSALGALRAQRALWRWLYAAGALFLALSLVLTYSRGAWLCFAAQLLLLGGYLLYRRFAAGREIERAALLWLGGLLALLALSLALPSVRDALSRIVDFSGYSMQGRLRFWSAALEIFRDHSLGVGLGNFAYYYPQYQLDYKYYSVDPHSWPLQLLCEGGVFGGLAALLLMLGFVCWVRRLWRGTEGSPVAVLLILAVSASLAHAAMDFDYTFGATTALLGALLAYGTYLAGAAQREPEASDKLPAPSPTPHTEPRWARVCAGIAAALLICAALLGEPLTLERNILDDLRDQPGLKLETKISLLHQAVRFNPLNFKTRYQLASLIANSGQAKGRPEALNNLELSLKLNPRFAKAWALKALLARPPAKGEADMEHSLKLDPYNFPENYFFWANLTEDDAKKKERLLLGLQRIPADDPITPEHIRPTWYELNPLFAEWYFELARLSTDEQEKETYLSKGARFKAYWEGVLRDRGQSSQPPLPSESGT